MPRPYPRWRVRDGDDLALPILTQYCLPDLHLNRSGQSRGVGQQLAVHDVASIGKSVANRLAQRKIHCFRVQVLPISAWAGLRIRDGAGERRTVNGH
jgi:hypothetical protein